MQAVPFLASLLCALALAPALARALQRQGWTAPNYRGRRLPRSFGLLIGASALLAGAPLLLADRLAHLGLLAGESAPVALYAGGVLGLGLLDDALAGEDGPRGLRAHAAAALRGRPSTGQLKAAGSLALALFALPRLGLHGERLALAVAVLLLCTHAFNLLDLRPGRAIKAFLALGAALTAAAGGAAPFSLALLSAPVLVAARYDLRERAMLGDAGSSLLGALGGLWIVLALGLPGQLAALALLAAIAAYGELRSISRLIDRTPGLRWLDSLGRS